MVVIVVDNRHLFDIGLLDMLALHYRHRTVAEHKTDKVNTGNNELTDA